MLSIITPSIAFFAYVVLASSKNVYFAFGYQDCEEVHEKQIDDSDDAKDWPCYRTNGAIPACADRTDRVCKLISRRSFAFVCRTLT